MIRTVKDLIAALQQCDQNAFVVVEDDAGNLFFPTVENHPSVPVTTGADYHRIGQTIAYCEIGWGESAKIPWTKAEEKK